MQFRMSPGGSMFSSLRRRPLDPPSSLTVTTAQRSPMKGDPVRAVRISSDERTNLLSPLSSVERPVPPPIATTRRPRSRAAFPEDRRAAVLVSMSPVPGERLSWLLFAEAVFRSAGIRVKKFRKAGILYQVLEV